MVEKMEEIILYVRIWVNVWITIAVLISYPHMIHGACLIITLQDRELEWESGLVLGFSQ